MPCVSSYYYADVMLQVRSAQGCCAFDMEQPRRELQIQGFHALMENDNVVKVFHDCRQAATALFYQKSISIRNVLDTQVILGSSLLVSFNSLCCTDKSS